MATTEFTSFLPEVLPAVKECPQPLAINAIRNATIDFCTQTLIWTETQTAVSVDSTDFPLTLTAPAGAVTVLIMALKIDGRKLTPTTQDALDSGQTNWEAVTGQPQLYFQPNPDQVVLYPLPDQAYQLTLRVAYAPSRSGTGVESYVYENYLDIIAAGALARLMLMPGVAWNNPELAAYYQGVYNNGVVDSMSDGQRSYTRASNRVSIQGF